MNLRNLNKFIIFIIISSLLFACGPETKKQMNISVNKQQGGFLKCSNITGNKKNKFIKYVDVRDIKNAEKLYFKHQNWFVTCEHKLDNYIPKLAGLINNKYNNKLNNHKKYFEKNHDEFEWEKFKQNHTDAKNLISLYKKERFLNSNSRYKIQIIKELENNISKNEIEFEKNINENFIKFDIFINKKSFFDVYPYQFSSNLKKNLINDTFETITQNFSDNKLIKNNNFIKNYFDYLSTNNKASINKLYLEKFYYENKIDEKNLSITEYLTVNDKILNTIPKNMDIPKINKELAFFDVTNSNINLDFQYKLKNDSKIVNHFNILNQENFNSNLKKYDYVFAFSIDDCKFETVLETKDMHQSEFVAGTRQINNPKYNKVINELNLSQNEEASAYYNQQYECNKSCPYGYEWTCVASCATWTAAYLKWSDRVSDAKRKLKTTPAYINENIYEPYQYYSTKVKASKYTKFNFIIFDNIKNKIYLKNDKLIENSNFDLVYNLNIKDEDKNRILKKYKEEKDINNWKNKNNEISIEKLINNFKKNYLDFKILETGFEIASLQKKSNNEIIANTSNQENDSFDYFKSVGKIIRGDGGFGTGFYITKNIIITNQHVIDNSNLINVELEDGTIGSASLIAQDYSKDLAALQTSIPGTPVKISNETLSLGKDVIAVGHPQGLGFTLTKGIISAIRKQQSINDFGLSEVQYIQTDAAINQGNSGGPLFLNGKLIGVNTLGVRKDIAEGLNFAVHKNELINFIKDNLKDYVKIK